MVIAIGKEVPVETTGGHPSSRYWGGYWEPILPPIPPKPWFRFPPLWRLCQKGGDHAKIYSQAVLREHGQADHSGTGRADNGQQRHG
jgi:hypothetical protein